MKQLIEIIPDNMKAYLNFLLYVEEKSQLDQERYEKLKKLLINGVEPGELKAMQKKFSCQAVTEVSVEKETLEKPRVEKTAADIIKEESIGLMEETQSEREHIEDFEPDFLDNEADELIEETAPTPMIELPKKRLKANQTIGNGGLITERMKI